MIKEYRNEIEKIENLQGVSIFWIDTIEWELDFGDLETAHTLLLKITGNESVIPELATKENCENVLNKYKIKKSIKQKFIPKKLLCQEVFDVINQLNEHFGNPSKLLRIEKPEPCEFKKTKFYQNFSVPTFMAKHITNSANSGLLSKLHQSSKYFFSTLPIPIIHRLVIKKCVKTRYIQQSLFVSDPKMNFSGDKKMTNPLVSGFGGFWS
uniref:Uncharacterized protein n=1 Tax=Panagrolaimus davidi TaxID=227884 RepID=A0A914QH37_9BILA